MIDRLTTRRAAIGALLAAPAVVALGPTASMASPSVDRTEWDRALAALERVKAEERAFDAFFNPLDERCSADIAAVPHVIFRPDPHIGKHDPITTADTWEVRRARREVADFDAGRIKYDPIPELHEHLQVCREVATGADERDAKIKAIRDRYGMDAAEDRWEALGEALAEADFALMQVPAPGLPELLFKLEKLLEVENGECTAGWSESYVRQTMADARRLLSREG